MNGSKNYVHLHNGTLCSRKKEGAPTLCNNMDGHGEYHAKWNKTVKAKYHMISPEVEPNQNKWAK